MLQKTNLLLFLIALLVGCTPTQVVVVTATPSPTATIAPSNTPEPTPTQEIILDNPHARCILENAWAYVDTKSDEYGQVCTVNPRPEFTGRITTVVVGDDSYDVTDGYTRVSGGQLGKAPTMRCIGSGVSGRDCVLSIEWLNGGHGYSFENTTIFQNQRYLVKVYSQLNTTWISTYQDELGEGGIGIGLAITKRGVTQTLDTRWITGNWVDLRTRQVSTLWLIEMVNDPSWQPRFTITVNIPYGIFQKDSTITLDRIEIIPVPDTYGSNPIRF